MSTLLNNVFTGEYFVNGFVLPSLSDEDSYVSILSTVDLSRIIGLCSSFIFDIKEKTITRNPDNTFVSIVYCIYFNSHFDCLLGEFVEPEYLEKVYTDSDDDFELGHEMTYAGLRFTNMKFKKEVTGWRRIA